MNLQINSGDRFIDIQVRNAAKIPSCLTDRPLTLGDTEQLKALKKFKRWAKGRIFYERMSKAKRLKSMKKIAKDKRLKKQAEKEETMSAYENGLNVS